MQHWLLGDFRTVYKFFCVWYNLLSSRDTGSPHQTPNPPNRPLSPPTMAIAGLQRISSKLIRNPTLTIISRSSATTTSSSAKVSDRIVKLIAYDFDGQKREIVGLSGQTLLKALTNHNLIDPASHRLEDIDACSAECEVNIAEEWLGKLPPASYDEQYVLKRNARHRILNKHSRLGCQVVLTQEMQGMVVAVPEPKPWDTP
ncbi:putative Beta-grasp domain superfamily, 2Fe-2S ferredoxin-like superfamily [Helianthus annuus]|uniref:Beta-grasp domain superfamily, 2Fe-2S ferredoxin-like superfamily n=2 Tax=Helianthus annuus TaxID=4232 RepID=A0A251U7A5_HELAN|nr:putative Beta-grasp domain superfamily, 2Fe-2S ferredoxin-like superfamily [Helianthus annuus]KAJ0539531.1 putative Beta-grasp domain superfamily, 2Fe-2S ferredoxin-like superfamily [Helianthus annuus]KAJ0554267.1 putative Beta-grasp domain superfamily, 2Fe-2S ferredoxin-like superfamily [Helianthus annuus]KAJ0898756.1 putative Beta-grasp domain superfamily, 2Fe-2S ferredoxin-like superfamily [Helianthus annuus]KAJ0902390.1 putative Beta-grasp domain superfamily, 2Fe-2S ferredoxin-like super